MELTESQKKAVTEWVNAGCGLSELQKKLSKEFNIVMTYMDVRFLTIDLGLEIQDKPESSVSRSEISDFSTAKPADSGFGDIGRGQSVSQSESGSVAVEVDHVTKAGSLVSGTVTFGDGVSASWFLDQFGRVALNAVKPDYSPSEEDLRAFQRELKKKLEKRGF